MNEPPKREKIQDALAVCERARHGFTKLNPVEWKMMWEFIDLTRDPQIGYEALLREHLRLMDDRDHTRKSLTKLTADFIEEALELYIENQSHPAYDGLGVLLKHLAQKVMVMEQSKSHSGGAPAQEKEQAK